LIIDTAINESISVRVFAQRADISNIVCKQLDNWTIG